VERHTRPVNRDLLKVRPAVSVELCVKVREQTALEKRILGKVDAAYNVARLELLMLVTKNLKCQAEHTITCSVSAK
jgi:hypothetical protein